MKFFKRLLSLAVGALLCLTLTAGADEGTYTNNKAAIRDNGDPTYVWNGNGALSHVSDLWAAITGKIIVWGSNVYGTNLPTVLTTLGTSNPYHLIPAPGTYAISADLVIPNNVALEVKNGVVFSVATAKTLTINGPFDAGLYQVFAYAGTGRAVFGANAVDYVKPAWWGATPSNGMQEANDSIAAVGGIVRITAGSTYTQTAWVKVSSYVTFDGPGYARKITSANEFFTLLTENPGAGATTVKVASVAGLAVGMTIFAIDDINSAEPRNFKNITGISGTTLTLDSALYGAALTTDNNARVAANTFPLFYLNLGVDRATIKNIYLDGNKANRTDHFPGINGGEQANIFSMGSTNFLLENIDSYNAIGDGLQIDGQNSAVHGKLNRVRSRYNGHNGFHFGTIMSEVVKEYCEGDYNTLCGFYHCTAISEIKVSNCNYNYNGMDGIRLDFGVTDPEDSRNVYTNCTAKFNQHHGFHGLGSVSAPYNPTQISIMGGYYCNNSQAAAGTYHGIYSYMNKYWTIIGAVCIDTQAVKTQGYGIYSLGSLADYFTVIGCFVSSNLTGGVSLFGGNNVELNGGTNKFGMAQVTNLGAGVAPTTDQAAYIKNTIAGKGALKLQQDVADNWALNIIGNPPEYAINVTGAGRNTFAGRLDIIGLMGHGGLLRLGTQFDKTNDAALANVPGLITPSLLGSAKYQFRAVLHINPAAAAGFKVAMGVGTGLTASTITYVVSAKDNATGAVIPLTSCRQTALAGAVGEHASGATSVEVIIEGTILTNAAGTLAVQFAQDSATEGVTSSVLVDSSLEVKRCE